MQFDHNIVAALVRMLGGKVEITPRDLQELRAGRLERFETQDPPAIHLRYHDDRAVVAVEARDPKSGRAIAGELLGPEPKR